MQPERWHQVWPCKPDLVRHRVSGIQPGETWPAAWWSCTSGDWRFQAMSIELPDPSYSALAMQRWQQSLADSRAGMAWQKHPHVWTGGTPFDGSGWWEAWRAADDRPPSPDSPRQTGPTERTGRTGQWAAWGGRGPQLVRLDILGQAEEGRRWLPAAVEAARRLAGWQGGRLLWHAQGAYWCVRLLLPLSPARR